MTAGFYWCHLDDSATSRACGDDNFDRDRLLAEPGRVEDWPGLPLSLEGAALDYLPNNVGVRLCSTRLRDVVEAVRDRDDSMQWLSVSVTDPDGTVLPYWALHFVRHPEVLHEERTIRARGDFVVKPVVDSTRAARHQLFAFPGATTRMIVSQRARDAIVDAGCTGVVFEPAPTA